VLNFILSRFVTLLCLVDGRNFPQQIIISPFFRLLVLVNLEGCSSILQYHQQEDKFSYPPIGLLGLGKPLSCPLFPQLKNWH